MKAINITDPKAVDLYFKTFDLDGNGVVDFKGWSKLTGRILHEHVAAYERFFR